MFRAAFSNADVLRTGPQSRSGRGLGKRAHFSSWPWRRNLLLRKGPIPLREGFRLHYNPHPNRFDSPVALPARVVIAPNASLSPEQAVWFMASISAVGLSIALVFACMGFWPVLPIAGLELMALGAALWVSIRGNAYREVVDVNDGHVIVEMGRVGEGARRTCCWPRAWTRIVLRSGANRLAPTELWLAFGAQRLQLARCLTDEERECLADRLKSLIKAPAVLPELSSARTG